VKRERSERGTGGETGKKFSALHGLNKAGSVLAGLERKDGTVRRFRSHGSLHRRLLTLRACSAGAKI